LHNAGGTFTNAATLTIGAIAGVGLYGLLNTATFNNNTGGQITIDRSTSIGLYNSSGSFTNAATVTIGGRQVLGTLAFGTMTRSTTTGGQIQLIIHPLTVCPMQAAPSPMRPPSLSVL
jgi:hypothetical protein